MAEPEDGRICTKSPYLLTSLPHECPEAERAPLAGQNKSPLCHTARCKPLGSQSRPAVPIPTSPHPCGAARLRAVNTHTYYIRLVVIATIQLLQLEVLIGDEVQRALLELEPDDTLPSKRAMSAQ